VHGNGVQRETRTEQFDCADKKQGCGK